MIMSGLRALSTLLRHGRGLPPTWIASCSTAPSTSSSIASSSFPSSTSNPSWQPSPSSSNARTAPSNPWCSCSFQNTAHISTSSAAAMPSPSAAVAAAAAKAPAPAAAKKGAKGRSGKSSMEASDELQAAPSDGNVPSVEALKASYQPSRLQAFWANVLSRELMLKLNIEHVGQLPRLEHVEVSIHARDVLRAANVEKWQMLLHALALEYVTGQPAQFTQSRQKYYRGRNAVTGVHVKLTKRHAFDFLEKLVYVVMPSQNAFEGLLMKSLDKGGNIHFRVSKMANYPDFEELYETFENLGGFHVNVKLSNVAKAPARTRLLLTGLQLPVFAKRRRAGGEDEDEAGEEGAGADAGAGAGAAASVAAGSEGSQTATEGTGRPVQQP